MELAGVLNAPIVPRPPILIFPNRQKGTESVVMTRGTTSRMTMTLAGSEGTSFSDIVFFYVEVLGSVVAVAAGASWGSGDMLWWFECGIEALVDDVTE